MITVSEQLEIVFNFVHSFEPDVAGRAREPVSPELEALIRDLAQGRLSREEATALLGRISQNPTAVEVLAECIGEGGEGSDDSKSCGDSQ